MSETFHLLPGGALALVPPDCAGCGANRFTLHWDYPADPAKPHVWTTCEYCGRTDTMTQRDLEELMTPPLLSLTKPDLTADQIAVIRDKWRQRYGRRVIQ